MGRRQRKSFPCRFILPPVLRQVDSMKPFILCTDVGNYALGAVLFQSDNHAIKCPTEFASRLLRDAHKNFTATECGDLAAEWALGNFRIYAK